jgi:hypothetical protein
MLAWKAPGHTCLPAIVRQQIIDGTLESGQPAPSITRLSQE